MNKPDEKNLVGSSLEDDRLYDGKPYSWWLSALKDKDQYVRRAAIDACGAFGQFPWTPCLDVEEIVSRLVKLLDDTTDTSSIRRVIKALERLGTRIPRPEQMALALARLLKHEDRWVRQDSIDALENLGAHARAAVPALLQMLQATRNASTAAEKIDYRGWARALAKIGLSDEGTRETVLNALRAEFERNGPCKEEIEELLGLLGWWPEYSVPELAQVLKRDPRKALKILQRIARHSEAAASLLLDILRTEPNATVPKWPPPALERSA